MGFDYFTIQDFVGGLILDKLSMQERREILDKHNPPQFPDFVEVSPFDTLRDPLYPTLKFLNFFFFKTKTRCKTCKALKTFKLIRNKRKGDVFTIKCKCGCDLIYPKSSLRNGERLWTRIESKDYRGKEDEGINK